MLRRLPLLVLLLLLPLPSGAAAREEPPEVFLSSGCRGCHFFAGVGGVFSPSLDKVGNRLSRERIAQTIRNHRAIDPQALMPSFDHLSDAEIATIADFLSRAR